MSLLFGESGRDRKIREYREYREKEMAREERRERERTQEKKKVMADGMVFQYKIHWRHLKDSN